LKRSFLNKRIHFRWFILKTHTGSEDVIKEELLLKLKEHSSAVKCRRIFIPTSVLKTSSEKIYKKKIFPGYLFIECQLNKKILTILQTLSKPVRFINSNPNPLNNADMLNLCRIITVKHVKISTYKNGEHVKIKNGPFTNFVGKIKNIQEKKKRAVVLLEILGRCIPMMFFYKDITVIT